MRNSWILPGLLLLVACGPTVKEPKIQNARENLEKNLQPRKVKLISPEIREENPSLEVVGDIRPFDKVDISPEVAGRVSEVLVEVGRKLSPGQCLLKLAPETFDLEVQQAEASLAAARANLDLAERELDRKQDLVSDHTIPQAVFDQARASRDLAKAQLQQAQSSLGLARHRLEVTEVRAPSAGAITRRLVAVGQWVDVGQALFELAVGDRVKVAARVPSDWALNLEGIKDFDFRLGNSETQRTAHIFSIDPIINEDSRSFEVVGTAPGDGIKAGAFARVLLRSLNVKRRLWLPVEAVVTSDTPRVLMVESSRVVVRRIETGPRAEKMVEVLSGLEEGEKVISSVAGLSRDLPVEIIE